MKCSQHKKCVTVKHRWGVIRSQKIAVKDCCGTRVRPETQCKVIKSVKFEK